jgi:multidrug efflux pump
VFVTGAGAKARNSIGLVLVGGMTIGTIFTLFIVPSLYVLIARTHNEGREDQAEAEPEEEPAPKAAAPRELPEPALARDGDLGWRPA